MSFESSFSCMSRSPVGWARRFEAVDSLALMQLGPRVCGRPFEVAGVSQVLQGPPLCSLVATLPSDELFQLLGDEPADGRASPRCQDPSLA